MLRFLLRFSSIFCRAVYFSELGNNKYLILKSTFFILGDTFSLKTCCFSLKNHLFSPIQQRKPFQNDFEKGGGGEENVSIFFFGGFVEL